MASISGNTAVKAVRQVVKANAGIVISAGKMQKTVTVRMAKQEWNRHLRKNYTNYYKLLVHDPNESLLTGDVVTLAQERYSKHVKHTVAEVLAPFGRPMSERPPLLSPEERLAIYQEKRGRKEERRAERRGLLKKDAAQEGDIADDGNVEVVISTDGGEAKMIDHGREVMPGGLHKYGDMNEELLKEKERIQGFQEKVERNQEDLKKIEEDQPEVPKQENR